MTLILLKILQIFGLLVAVIGTIYLFLTFIIAIIGYVYGLEMKQFILGFQPG